MNGNVDNNKGVKYLVKNMGLISLGTFSTSLLSFLLVPLYTSILSTSDYGNYDIVNTTIALLLPFLTLSIEEPVMRFALDKDKKNIKSVFSIGVKHVGIGIIIVGILIVFNHFFLLFKIIDDYWLFFILLYSFTSICNLMTFFARGLERVSDVAISGVVGSFFCIFCNIVFLIPLNMGLLGYFLAQIAGVAIQSVFLFCRLRGWRYIIRLRNISKTQEQSMIHYSTPMIANTVSWWINNASDRYIVTWFNGVAANGIYSVAYKIPTILNVFQRIFLQAWTISAVKDFDPEDRNGFFSCLYNSYNFLMVLLCSILIILDKTIAHFLYSKDFYAAWVYVPFLLISTVFGALNGFMGGIFSAVKKSKMYALSTTIGAVVNLVLNIILVYIIGALGAAIATAICYWIVWIIRRRFMHKFIKIKNYIIRDYLSYFLLVVQSVILLNHTGDIVILYVIQCLIMLFIVFLYYKELIFVKDSFKTIIRSKHRGNCE